jgi:hypothetical protein
MVKVKPEEKLKANITYHVLIEQKNNTCKFSIIKFFLNYLF